MRVVRKFFSAEQGVVETQHALDRHPVVDPDLHLGRRAADRAGGRDGDYVEQSLDRLIASEDQDWSALAVGRLVPPDLTAFHESRWSSHEKPTAASASSSSTQCCRRCASAELIEVPPLVHSVIGVLALDGPQSNLGVVLTPVRYFLQEQFLGGHTEMVAPCAGPNWSWMVSE